MRVCVCVCFLMESLPISIQMYHVMGEVERYKERTTKVIQTETLE